MSFQNLGILPFSPGWWCFFLAHHKPSGIWLAPFLAVHVNPCTRATSHGVHGATARSVRCVVVLACAPSRADLMSKLQTCKAVPRTCVAGQVGGVGEVGHPAGLGMGRNCNSISLASIYSCEKGFYLWQSFVDPCLITEH